jgi:hypothetical protein
MDAARTQKTGPSMSSDQSSLKNFRATINDTASDG